MELSSMTDEATRILGTAVETYRVSRSSGNQERLERLRHFIAEQCREHLQFDPSPVPASAPPNQGKSPISWCYQPSRDPTQVILKPSSALLDWRDSVAKAS
jgi:hypothetical protein